MNIHASQQEGRESCAQKQDLAVPKFRAWGESEDEWIIYASPLPCIHIEAVEVHMDCYQHERAELKASHTKTNTVRSLGMKKSRNGIYQKHISYSTRDDLTWKFCRSLIAH